jgi:hypothetical protein
MKKRKTQQQQHHDVQLVLTTLGLGLPHWLNQVVLDVQQQMRNGVQEVSAALGLDLAIQLHHMVQAMGQTQRQVCHTPGGGPYVCHLLLWHDHQSRCSLRENCAQGSAPAAAAGIVGAVGSDSALL